MLISGIIGMYYMLDAWKVSIDGAVYDESDEWTVCRLIRKYAPYNPTIVQRFLLVLPIFTIIMFLTFMYLMAIIGFKEEEMGYFYSAVIISFIFIGRKTYLYTKY